MKIKGYACGIGAAVSYGLNPLGALPLYAEGVNTNTVLFFRYIFAVLLLAVVMRFYGKTFSVTGKELAVLAPLGVLFAVSSITLFYSFHFMEAGIACTLLFVYPVLVAVIMAVFFKERLTKVAVFSVCMALCGIALLYKGDGDDTLSLAGVMFVMASSLSYAVYIVIVNKSSLSMSSLKLTFYVLVFGVATIVVCSFLGGDDGRLGMLTTGRMWLCAWILALFPTVISLILMTIAVHEIGSTPTAVMGSLEPVTAVFIGLLLFGEEMTSRLAVGIMLILAAVILIIVGKSLTVKNMTTVISRLGQVVVKRWRWK